MGVTFAFLQAFRHFCQLPWSKCIESCLAVTSPSSLGIYGYIPSKPMDSCVQFAWVFLDQILFHQGCISCVTAFLSALRDLGFLKAGLPCRGWGKGGFSISVFSMSCVTKSPVPFGSGLPASLAFLLPFTYRSAPFCLWHPSPDLFLLLFLT